MWTKLQCKKVHVTNTNCKCYKTICIGFHDTAWIKIAIVVHCWHHLKKKILYILYLTGLMAELENFI